MHVHLAFCKYVSWQITILQFEKHTSLIRKYFDHRDGRVYRRRGVFVGSRIFIRECLFPSVITSPELHLLFLRLCCAVATARGLFSLTSVCRAPCAAIPLAICNCFRSATKNETRNEVPDSRGS